MWKISYFTGEMKSFPSKFSEKILSGKSKHVSSKFQFKIPLEMFQIQNLSLKI